MSPISSRKMVPPWARSKRPILFSDRAGERPAHVAEELALEQALGQRRAVDLDQRTPRTATGGVEGVRDQLLAGAAFAGDEHRGVDVGERSDHRSQLFDRLAPADDSPHLAGLGEAALELDDAGLVANHQHAAREAPIVAQQRRRGDGDDLVWHSRAVPHSMQGSSTGSRRPTVSSSAFRHEPQQFWTSSANGRPVALSRTTPQISAAAGFASTTSSFPLTVMMASRTLRKMASRLSR